MKRSLYIWVIAGLYTIFLKPWKRIIRSYQSHRQGRSWQKVYIISTSFLACVMFIIWRTDSWYIFQVAYYHFVPEKRGWLPRIDAAKETLKCKHLLHVARSILEGDDTPLPFDKKKTLWTFKKQVALYELENNEKTSLVNSQEQVQKYNVNGSDIKAQKLFITFGHNCCLYSKHRALHQARTVGGFDHVHSFNMYSLSSKFRQMHNDVLGTRHGAGNWVWKPYVVLKTLIENMYEGDMVMYQDAGAYLNRSAAPLLKLCQESSSGIIIFKLPPRFIEHDYTKMDTMILMNITMATRQSTQRMASFLVIKKNCATIQFVMEWLAYLLDRRIASDDDNTMGSPNAKSFIAHRHDQSVLSLLSKKWGIPALRDPSGHGLPVIKTYYGPYEQLIVHDRFRY